MAAYPMSINVSFENNIPTKNNETHMDLSCIYKNQEASVVD